MCLWSIDKETKQVSEGWKVFGVKDNKLCPPFYKDGIKFVINKWTKDTNKQNIKTLFNTNEYQPGFHFYLNKKDAENKLLYRKFKILKVKVKNVVATGTEGVMLIGIKKVGVAKEIFIEEE